MTRESSIEFELGDFLPYLLNQAAEVASVDFQAIYRSEYGMLQTEWRVLFHLGRYGEMTATEIGRRSRIHKTKISRAVAALESKRFLVRNGNTTDRRSERLSLSRAGLEAYRRLGEAARRYDEALASELGAETCSTLKKALRRIAQLQD